MSAAVYIDGFNLYHPIHELNLPHLKWLNLWRLSERICQDRSHKLVKVVYCTAYRQDDPSAKQRHGKYIEALDSVGVETVLGHYIKSPQECKNCGDIYEKPSEKQTDINIAVHALRDAICSDIKNLYILSADSDQAATFEMLSQAAPNKGRFTVAPPTKKVSRLCKQKATGQLQLTIDDLKHNRFPSIIVRDGNLPIRCPAEYDLPK